MASTCAGVCREKQNREACERTEERRKPQYGRGLPGLAFADAKDQAKVRLATTCSLQEGMSADCIDQELCARRLWRKVLNFNHRGARAIGLSRWPATGAGMPTTTTATTARSGAAVRHATTAESASSAGVHRCWGRVRRRARWSPGVRPRGRSAG